MNVGSQGPMARALVAAATCGLTLALAACSFLDMATPRQPPPSDAPTPTLTFPPGIGTGGYAPVVTPRLGAGGPADGAPGAGSAVGGTSVSVAASSAAPAEAGKRVWTSHLPLPGVGPAKSPVRPLAALAVAPPGATSAHVVVPVVLVASDLAQDAAGIEQAAANLGSVVAYVQAWYARQVGTTFPLATPIVATSNLTAQAWFDLTEASTDDKHRYDFTTKAIEALKASGVTIRSEVAYVVCPYIGDARGVWLGAADQAAFAVVPPRASSLRWNPGAAPGADILDVTYGIGHELGHAFGLAHACQSQASDSRCRDSWMEANRSEDAILLQAEIETLRRSPFFTVDAPAR